MIDKVWLLTGPEIGERDIYVSQFKKKLKESLGETPELHNFYPFNTSMREILSLARNGSLFSSSRLMIIKQAELLKKQDMEDIKDYLDSPSKDAILVFISDEVAPKNGISKLIPKKNQKIFWEMYEGQKKGWLAGFFRNRKIHIEPDAIELLLSLIENNTSDMKRECEKLALYFGENSQIKKDEIEEFFYHGKEENVFSLFNKIAESDLAGSLEILQKILLGNETNTVQLLAGLLWQFRNLKGIAEAVSKGENFKTACLKNNIRAKKSQTVYSEALKHYTKKNLRDIIQLTSDYDIKLRNAKQDQKEIIAQIYLYLIIEKKGLGEI